MKSFICLCLLIVFSACATKINVQKRRYNKGFHWAVFHKQNTTATTTTKTKNQNTSDNKLVLDHFNKENETKINDKLNANNKITENASYAIQSFPEKKVYTAAFLKRKHTMIQLHKIKTYKRVFSSRRKQQPDKENNIPGTALFVLVCVLAGFFAVAGIGYFILYLSTSASAYLLFALVSALLSALFFVIMNSMNQVE